VHRLLGAAYWDVHVEPLVSPNIEAVSLLAMNPKLEVVQYEQCGHHAHRMTALADRFARDLEDFVMRVC